MKKYDDEYSSEDLRDLIDEELADASDGSAFIATALDEDGETFYWAPKTVGSAILYLYNESDVQSVRRWIDNINDRHVYYPDTNEIEDLIKRTIFFMGEEYKNSPLGQFYDSKTSDNGLTKYRKEALKIWPE